MTKNRATALILQREVVMILSKLLLPLESATFHFLVLSTLFLLGFFHPPFIWKIFAFIPSFSSGGITNIGTEIFYIIWPGAETCLVGGPA